MPRMKWSEIKAKAAPETLEAAARDVEAMIAEIGKAEAFVPEIDAPPGGREDRSGVRLR